MVRCSWFPTPTWPLPAKNLADRSPAFWSVNGIITSALQGTMGGSKEAGEAASRAAESRLWMWQGCVSCLSTSTRSSFKFPSCFTQLTKCSKSDGAQVRFSILPAWLANPSLSLNVPTYQDFRSANIGHSYWRSRLTRHL